MAANGLIGINSKLVHRPHQPQIAFLDQVEHRQATVAKVHRDMNDQPEIGLHHLRFGRVQCSLGPPPGLIGHLQGGIVRIAHCGYYGGFDIVIALTALEMALRDLGADVEPGAGAGAAQRVFADEGAVPEPVAS